MNKFIYFVLFITNFSLICVNANSDQKYFVNKNGYGPVLIGMSVIEASKALGHELKPANPLDDDEKNCHYVYPDGDFSQIAFMVENGFITRIDVRNDSYLTDSGIKVGDSANIIGKVYNGKTTEKIHPYLGESGKYIIVDTKEGFQIIFETDHGLITSFRSGRLPSVSYIEGCL